MGKDSTLLITIFSLLELSPANRMEKNINFPAWLYPMSKGFYGQRPRAQHAKALPGAGGHPAPSPHPAPGGDTPRPPRQGQRVTAAGDRAGGQLGGFPSSALILLGSSSWGALAGASGGDRQPTSPPLLQRWLLNQTLPVLTRKRGRQVPTSLSGHLAQYPSLLSA